MGISLTILKDIVLLQTDSATREHMLDYVAYVGDV